MIIIKAQQKCYYQDLQCPCTMYVTSNKLAGKMRLQNQDPLAFVAPLPCQTWVSRLQTP